MVWPGGSGAIITRKAAPLKAILVIQQFGFMSESFWHPQECPWLIQGALEQRLPASASPLPPNRTLIGWIFRWFGRRAWYPGVRSIPPRLILAADCGPSSVCYTSLVRLMTFPLSCGLRPFLGLLHLIGHRLPHESSCGLRPFLGLLHFISHTALMAKRCGLRPFLGLLHYDLLSMFPPSGCGLRPFLGLLH